MAKRVRIKGVIIPQDYAFYYEYFQLEHTTPGMIRNAIEEANGDQLIVEISSPGGEIASGSEIYSMLKSYGNVKIEITGEACSAASVIAMAGYCEMASTALMMVHCVSTAASGNYSQMEHAAEVLRTADSALCTAYTAKSGMTESDALEMMERETWLTASKALELGLIDGILNQTAPEPIGMVAGMFRLPNDSQLEQVRKAMAKSGAKEGTRAMKAKLRMLRLGERKR